MTVVSSGNEMFKSTIEDTKYKCTKVCYLLSSSEILDLSWGCHTGLNTLNGQAVEMFQYNPFTPIHNLSSISHYHLQTLVSSR